MNFDTIVERISPTLKNITYKLNGHFTFFNDDDLLQESLLHLWLEYQEGKLENKTDSYILQGCYFYLKNYLRRVNTDMKFVSIEALLDDENTSSKEILSLRDKHSENDLDNLNNKIIVENLMKSFDKREKDVLNLIARGLTTREIGDKLDISHVAVIKITNKIRGKCGKYVWK
ncbi:MAG: sigma-70 family RNA polymerase sigma factor [bacterium]|nr:sigma-70 family RNA polymerase sigma factor [bacterium]